MGDDQRPPDEPGDGGWRHPGRPPQQGSPGGWQPPGQGAGGQGASPEDPWGWDDPVGGGPSDWPEPGGSLPGPPWTEGMGVEGVEHGVAPPAQRNPLATASLVLGVLAGVLALLFFVVVPALLAVPLGLAAVVLGLLGLRRARSARVGRGSAIAGLATGALGALVSVVFLVWLLTAVGTLMTDEGFREMLEQMERELEQELEQELDDQLDGAEPPLG